MDGIADPLTLMAAIAQLPGDTLFELRLTPLRAGSGTAWGATYCPRHMLIHGVQAAHQHMLDCPEARAAIRRSRGTAICWSCQWEAIEP